MRLSPAWTSRRALVIAAGLVVVAALASPAVARNVEATRLLRALPCTTDRPACLTELVALHPVGRADEPDGPHALTLSGTDGLLVALDGAGGRPDGWAPRQATLAIDFQREPSEWSDPEARYLAFVDGIGLHLLLRGPTVTLLVYGEAPDNPAYELTGAFASPEREPDAWHRIVGTWDWDDPDRWLLALDGAIVTTTRQTHGAPTTPRVWRWLRFGKYSLEPEEQVFGVLGDVSLLARPLAPAEIVALGNRGRIDARGMPPGAVVFSTTTDGIFLAQVAFRRSVLAWSRD